MFGRVSKRVIRVSYAYVNICEFKVVGLCQMIYKMYCSQASTALSQPHINIFIPLHLDFKDKNIAFSFFGCMRTCIIITETKEK